jgi:hypothetical protein
MEEKMQKRSGKEMEIQFIGIIEFDGPVSEFKAVMTDLEKLTGRGLKVGTWPTPEHPAKGMMIDTVPLPERPGRGLMIDTIPLPENDLAGIYPIARHLSRSMLNKLTKGMPTFKLIKDINGGIRCAHLHLHDEVVLLDREGFKEAVEHVAAELAGRLAETTEYMGTVGAIRHMGR